MNAPVNEMLVMDIAGCVVGAHDRCGCTRIRYDNHATVVRHDGRHDAGVRAAVAPDCRVWTTGTQNNQERCVPPREHIDSKRSRACEHPVSGRIEILCTSSARAMWISRPKDTRNTVQAEGE